MAINLDRPVLDRHDANAKRDYRFVGLSTDTKPLTNADGTALTAGCEFYEEDTAAGWYWAGSTWIPSGGVLISDLIKTTKQANQEIIELLKSIRDETRATRLAAQEWINEGNQNQHDFLELALTVGDRDENEEPL